MRVSLADLPREHPARNTPLEKLDTLLARNTVAGFAKDPRTWRACKACYNDLTDAWQFTEWTISLETTTPA